MKLKKKLSIAVGSFAFVVVLNLIARADYVSPTFISNLSGAPSSIQFGSGAKKIHNSQKKWVKIIPLPAPAPAMPLPPKPGRPNVYETVAYNVVNPVDGKAVSGLNIIATVHIANKPDRTIAATSGSDGKLMFPKIGPIPAVLDVSLSQQYDNPNGDPEWRFVHSKISRLSIDNPIGTKVAEVPHPYEVATTGALPASSQHLVFYQSRPQTLVVERTVVDLAVDAPPGATLTTPAMPDISSSAAPAALIATTVPDNGKVDLKLSASALQLGPIPIRAAIRLPGGTAESVLTSYDTNPYTLNNAQFPPVKLVQLSSVRLLNNAHVLESGADVKHDFGDLAREHNKGQIVHDGDGSVWWQYNVGLDFKMRPTPGSSVDKPNYIAERIRLADHNGGVIAGISPGSDVSAIAASFGSPDGNDSSAIDSAFPLATTESVDSYLQHGMRIGHDGARTTWIELVRPTSLLTNGTTAFMARNPAKLYINSFQGDARTGLTDRDALVTLLEHMPSVTLVDNKDDADLILDASASFTDEHQDLTSVLPLYYSATTTITYSLTDASTGNKIADNLRIPSVSKADYRNDVAGSAAVLLILEMDSKSQAVKEIVGLLGAAGVAELNDTMRKAVHRCPGISARSSVEKFVQAIDTASDYHVRVISANYGAGTLRLNVGSADGIKVSTPAQPFEFDIQVGDQYLPHSESGLKADYYAAVVTNVDTHTCDCELHHITRGVHDMIKPYENDSLAGEMLQQIPDPATGIVSARAESRTPEIDSLPSFNPAPMAVVNTLNNSTNAQGSSSVGKQQSPTLQSLLGGLLGKKNGQ